MKHILIVKTSAIGDVITSLDVLAYLHMRFPSAKLDWVVEKAGASLLQAHPRIDRVLVCDTKKWRKSPFCKETREEIKQFHHQLRENSYDVLFDLQGNTKSGVVTALAKAKHKVGFSLKTVPEMPNVLVTNRRFLIPNGGGIRKRYLDLVQAYFEDKAPFHAAPIRLRISPEENERLSNLLQETPYGPKLMVALGSKWKNKQLCDEVATEVLHLIDQELTPTFFFPFGNDEEKQRAEILASAFPKRGVVVGEMSLPFWQSLMREMACVLTMDSAALHLCGTTATPSFSFFGPSRASVFKPPGKSHRAMQGVCPYKVQFAVRCPKLRTCPTGACMQSYKAPEIAAQFIQAFSLWQKLPPAPALSPQTDLSPPLAHLSPQE